MKRGRDAVGLTREQLEAGDYGSEAEDGASKNDMNKASAQVLGQRKIVKVKRHIQETGEVKTNVPDKPAQFKLVGALSSGATGATSKPAFQFNANNNGTIANTDNRKENNGTGATTESKNLFDNNGQKKFAVASGGTFGGIKIGEVKQITTTSSLFGQNAVAAPLFKPIQGGEFGGKKLEASNPSQPPPTKPEESKPAAPNSLFGGIKPSPGGSLFGNLNTVKSDTQPSGDPAKKTSLFGTGNPPLQPQQSAGDGNQKYGLFFKTKSESEKKASSDEQSQLQQPQKAPLFAQGSLFGGQAPAPSASGAGAGAAPQTTSNQNSIFANKAPTGGSLLFGGQSTQLKPGQSLFGGANAGSSLFSFSAQQQLPAGSGGAAQKQQLNDDDDEAGDEEQQGEKSPPIYADSTTKVEFKGAGAQNIQPSPYTKLFEKHVNTFKVVKPEDQSRKITNCEVSIEFAETNQKKVFLVVVRQAKKVLIQSTINAKQSRIRRVEEKSAKNQLKVCVQQIIDVEKKKEDGTKEIQKKMIFPYCVVNFSRQEEMINFETEFNKAINDLKAQ